jgi:hypothetical protein
MDANFYLIAFVVLSVIAVACGIAWVVLTVRANRLRRYIATLEADLQSDLATAPVPVQRFTENDDRVRNVNRLPNGPNSREVRSPRGTFAITKVDGGYENGNIFVSFPPGVGFIEDLANAFHDETEGRYIMRRPQPSACGGSDNADAIIRAAFHDHPLNGTHAIRPDLDETRNLLEELAKVFLAKPVWTRR